MSNLVHGISRGLLQAAFCDYFGLRGEHADILVALYERQGEPIPTKELATLLNSHRPPTRGAIQERIRFIREIMEPESLDTGAASGDRWEASSGYFLTEQGVAECVKALRVMAEVLTYCSPAATNACRALPSAVARAHPRKAPARTQVESFAGR